MNKALDYLNNLLKEKDTVVVCLSGGPDSMCLLALLLKVRESKNINLIATHVNHSLRKASNQEKIMVEKYCEENNVTFEYMKIEKYHSGNFHAEARNIRYNFFVDVVKKYNAAYLMTAHHGDDLMETILMRIVRGSTLNGYAGFKQITKKDSYYLVRPLIHNTKKEIKEYNKQNKIPYANDASNKKDKYTRNRFRKYVLTFLKKEDPIVHEKFNKFSNDLYLCSEYVNSEVTTKLKKIYQNNTLDINKFIKEDKFIQNKIIEVILEKLYIDNLFLISDIHRDEIIALINNKKSNAFVNLPSDYIAKKNYDKLVIVKNTKEKVKTYNLELKDRLLLPNNWILEITKTSDDTSNYTTKLLKNEITLPIKVRTKLPGDKMSIKKLNGTKKIKDIFINEKIPLDKRDAWPIVTDNANNIIWLPGIKKSKFDKSKNEKYDIIIKYYQKGED